MTEGPLPRLKEVLASALGTRESIVLLCYTSFGIVRGTLPRQAAAAEAGSETGLLIELRDAVVEHYSNHLPTEKYPQIYLNLSDIRGLALSEE